MKMSLRLKRLRAMRSSLVLWLLIPFCISCCSGQTSENHRLKAVAR